MAEIPAAALTTAVKIITDGGPIYGDPEAMARAVLEAAALPITTAERAHSDAQLLKNAPAQFGDPVRYLRWLESEVDRYRTLAGDVIGQFELSGLRYRAAAGKILMTRWRQSLRGEL